MSGISHSPPQEENTGTAAVEELLMSVKMCLCLTEPSAHSLHPRKARGELMDLAGVAHQAALTAHSLLPCPSGAIWEQGVTGQPC